MADTFNPYDLGHVARLHRGERFANKANTMADKQGCPFPAGGCCQNPDCQVHKAAWDGHRAIVASAHKPEPSPAPAADTTAREWLIWSLDHKTWWGPNRTGYTRVIADAGRYTFAEGRSIMKLRNFRCGSTLDQHEQDVAADLMVPAPEYVDASSHLSKVAEKAAKEIVAQEGFDPDKGYEWQVNFYAAIIKQVGEKV